MEIEILNQEKMDNYNFTKGKWILDSDDMLTIRAINTDGRIFITKANTLEYYEKGYKFSIAKAMAKKDNIEVERLRKELFQFDAEQFANARLISKAPEMLEFLQRLVSSEMTPLAIRKQAKKLIKEATEL